MPPVEKVELSFVWSVQSVHIHCNAKSCVFIAAILSELHDPWQLVMQGYVIGLPTLNMYDATWCTCLLTWSAHAVTQLFPWLMPCVSHWVVLTGNRMRQKNIWILFFLKRLTYLEGHSKLSGRYERIYSGKEHCLISQQTLTKIKHCLV